MDRLIELGDREALDVRLVGAKAAALAAALAHDLPVLPGWVVPIYASRVAAAAGSAALRSSGHAAAVLAVSAVELEDRLIESLVSCAARSGPVIVRSSSVTDADQRWAGALATYQEVFPDDVGAAVLGCWASAFSRDAVERAAAMECDPARNRVAVLVQPWVAFLGGGTATVGPRGSVEVCGVAGPPSDLASGRLRGSVATADTNGEITGDTELAGLGRATVRAVAQLARATRVATGFDVIEWGLRGGDVILLQARRVSLVAAPPSPFPQGVQKTLPAVAERVAWLAARFPGPLGDALVLPWAILSTERIEAALAKPQWSELPDRARAFHDAIELARVLTAEAWGSGQAGRDSADAAVRGLLGPNPERALRNLEEKPRACLSRAVELLQLVGAIGRSLTNDGLLLHPEQVWRLRPNELESAVVRGIRPARRRGPSRWEPFVVTAVSALGEIRKGVKASDGFGAGRVVVIRKWPDRPLSRPVVVAETPVPWIAPLLWDAAGLVVSSGNPGAHLFEVARSLRVPAVIGVDLSEAEGDLVAVRGDYASVARLRANPEAGVTGNAPSMGTITIGDEGRHE